MKRTLTLIFTFQLTLFCFGQNNIVGIYNNHFGEKIELKFDSTFVHTNRFDLSSSWTNGKWKIFNDTIYLKTILVLDTLQIRNSEKIIWRDSLVLSSDSKSNRIEMEEYVVTLISGGGQNRVKPPEKLYLKNEKLYLINANGEIDKKKIEQFWTRKKYKTNFKKTE